MLFVAITHIIKRLKKLSNCFGKSCRLRRKMTFGHNGGNGQRLQTGQILKGMAGKW
jgi:hypothetical protein